MKIKEKLAGGDCGYFQFATPAGVRIPGAAESEKHPCANRRLLMSWPTGDELLPPDRQAFLVGFNLFCRKTSAALSLGWFVPL